ncbi:MAG: 5'-methylthioadenosine/adenosylhomocysteine nucleosidase [Treponema sp.]|nr:5'-methylthioadenosine/adenosylhomocysteine nucleosidase [Treponema sp.]
MAEKIGIIGAMETEVKMLQSKLENQKCTEFAGLKFFEGSIAGKNLVIVRSGVGKVNAALCAQTLALKFGVEKIINTGIAGATGGGLGVFDFVASTEAVYHDLNIEFFGYKPGQVPGMEPEFKADSAMADAAVKAFANTKFAGEHKILKGRIASGDQFISDTAVKNKIKEVFNPLCVEMEGAAIAHACTLNKVPFVIIRCMSDMADDAGENVYNFNEDTAADASAQLILELIKLI